MSPTTSPGVLDEMEAGLLRIHAERLRENDATAPLSYTQLYCWSSVGSARAADLKIPLVRRLRGSVSTEVLERSLVEVVDRHEALRTTFPPRYGQPIARVEPLARFAVEVTDLAGSLPAPADREEEALRLTDEEARRPFDLTTELPFRARVIRLGAEDHLLLLTMSHIVADDWSVPVLLGDLSELVAAAREGRPSPLPELHVQVADFAAWQRQTWTDEAVAQAVRRWQRPIRPCSMRLVNHYRDDSADGSTHVDPRGTPIAVPTDVLDRLRGRARSHRATLFMALMAAVDVVVSALTDTSEVVVSTYSAKRTHPWLASLVGWFAEPLPIVVDLSGDPDAGALLERVRDETLRAFTYQDVPYRQLQRHLAAGRREVAPLLQVVVTLRDAPPSALTVPGLVSEGFACRSEDDPSDPGLPVEDQPFQPFLGGGGHLWISLRTSSRGLRGRITLGGTKLSQWFMDRLARSLEVTVTALATDPYASVAPLIEGVRHVLQGKADRAA